MKKFSPNADWANLAPMTGADLDTLETAARGGDAAAQTALGKRLTVGRDAPFEPERGVKLLEQAFAQGDADATAIMAALTGAGAWVPQSWPKALDLLQSAAERGSADAQQQLKLLSQTHGENWAALRAGINLERWITPPESRQVQTAPKIWVVEKFASAEICDWLMNKARGRLARAEIFTGGQTEINRKRSNTSFGVDIVESGVLTLLLRFRIMGATTVSVTQMEPPNILHYAPGEEYVPHHDCIHAAANRSGRAEQGDRLATFLLYLNDGYDGGELEFPRIGFRHKGAKGDAVFFANMTDAAPDPLALHAGLPVRSGEKWLFSQWIRDRPLA